MSVEASPTTDEADKLETLRALVDSARDIIADDPRAFCTKESLDELLRSFREAAS